MYRNDFEIYYIHVAIFEVWACTISKSRNQTPYIRRDFLWLLEITKNYCNVIIGFTSVIKNIFITKNVVHIQLTINNEPDFACTTNNQ